MGGWIICMFLFCCYYYRLRNRAATGVALSKEWPPSVGDPGCCTCRCIPCSAWRCTWVSWGKPDRSRRWRSAECRSKAMPRGLRLGADCTFQLIGKENIISRLVAQAKIEPRPIGLCSSNVDSVADFMSCCWFHSLQVYKRKFATNLKPWNQNANSLFNQIAACLHQYLTQVVDVNVGHGTSFRSW